MNLFYHFWKVWLCNNDPNTETSNEYHAEVATKRFIKNNEKIAEQLANETDINYNTLIYAINQYDRVIREMLCEGFTVQTNNFTIAPQLPGKWDPTKPHSLANEHTRTIDCKLRPEMNQALEFVGIDVLGIKTSTSYISQVLDQTSGKQDSILTRDGEVVISGNGIRAIDKDGSENNCIFLTKNDRTKFNITKRDLLKNDSEQIIVHLPKNIEKGEYYLTIQTYHIDNSDSISKLLNCIEYDKILTVK